MATECHDFFPQNIKSAQNRSSADPERAWKLVRAPGAARIGADRLVADGGCCAPDDIRELAVGLGVSYKQNADGMFNPFNLITVPNPEGEIVRRRAGRDDCKRLPLPNLSHDSIHLV
jgi:hypothetical protein